MAKVKLKNKIPVEDPVLNLLEKQFNAKKQLKEKETKVSYADIFKIKKYSKNVIENNEDILNIFPDLELAKEILVSSILSPNDMVSVNLNYKIKNIQLPVDIKTMISDTIRNHVKEEYNYLDKLPTIIEETLFSKGSYAEIIIPDSFISKSKLKITAGLESTVDAISKINNTGIIRTKSLLKDGNESILEITDNSSVLLAEDIYYKQIEENLENNLAGTTVGYEANVVLNKAFRNEVEEVVTITNDGNNSGIPLVKKVFPESVIPICSKTDPSKHFGYFILVDETGAPLNTELTNDPIVGLDNSKNENSMLTKKILNRAKKLLYDTLGKEPTLSNLNELKEELVIKKLQTVLKDSKIGKIAKLDINDREEIIDILLDRILKSKKTKILFVPENLLAYYAIRYRKNGTGESLLERITVLSSFRAIIIFVSLLSFIKSSIPITNVNAQLDENDVDYEKTMEKIMSEVLKNRQLNLPIGILKVDDLVDWVHKIGFAFNFKHPGLPDIDINIEEKNPEVEPVNTDLKQMIDKHIILALGLTPEIIDNAYSPDFATTIVANNTLLNKRISKYQEQFNKLITKNIKKQAIADGLLKRKLEDIIRPNIKSIKTYLKRIKHNLNINIEELLKIGDDTLVDFIIRNSIKGLDITLPKPEIKDNDNLGDLFNKYKDSLDNVLDLLFSEDALPEELIGEFSGKIENIKNVIKTILIKKWISENGYLTDVTELMTIGDDGKPTLNLLEEYETYVEVLEKAVLPFLKTIKKKSEQIDKKLSKIEEDNEDEDENENSDTGSSEENDNELDNTEESDTEEDEGMEEGIDTEEEDTGSEEDTGTGEEELPDL